MQPTQETKLQNEEAPTPLQRATAISLILAESSKLRGGKHELCGQYAHGRFTATQEHPGETLEVPHGYVLKCRSRTCYTELMPSRKLASALRATFDTLGIEAETLELDQGVWISDKTLDRIAQWSNRQPLKEEIWNVAPPTRLRDDASTGPLKFALAFDKALTALQMTR